MAVWTLRVMRVALLTSISLRAYNGTRIGVFKIQETTARVSYHARQRNFTTLLHHGVLRRRGAVWRPGRKATHRQHVVSPNEKAHHRRIGWRHGGNDIDNLKSENIVALCDVDDAHAAHTFDKFPKGAKYRDYRVMLKSKRILTRGCWGLPITTHALLPSPPLQLGKHVYCEKPLAHSILRSAQNDEVARNAKSATQMGQPGPGIERHALLRLIWAGAIGNVREIHGWCNRNPSICRRGMPSPKVHPQ